MAGEPVAAARSGMFASARLQEVMQRHRPF